MHHNFDYTNQLLHNMAAHFQTISNIVREEELYDHSIALNQDLFQTYFNMSISIATEMNYLEKKDDELDKVLE